ncbi:hypothetical protein [Klebsiella pneumoniae]|uniref:hypothetical protein n=1 Tax=Klebsiella pneumoniae TaxID=573 RepID=UPI000F523CCC|nr:hypothetical protein [Klebsiella pneumoniae]
MELFDLLTIKITLPAQAVPARKVGGNLVHKLLFRSTTVSAQVRNARFPGYFELVTGLKPPLDYIYLKDPNSRGKCSDGVASLKAKEPFTFEKWREDTELIWEQFPEQAFSTSPDEINEQWHHQFQFRETIQSAIIQVLENPNWVHFMQSQAISLLICR